MRGHCSRSKNKIISDVLPWTPSNGCASAGRLTRTYVQQLCADTGYSLEDLTVAMDDMDECRESEREKKRESQRNLCKQRAAHWAYVECLLMVRKTEVSIPGRVIPKTQKCYLMPPCLTLSIIRYGSNVNGAI